MFSFLFSNAGYNITYQMMNASDDAKMVMLNQAGISVCRVTKLSKNAAVRMTGIMPIVIFNPAFAPFFTDTKRVCVLGKSKLLPKMRPAAPAMINDEISNVPWIHMTSTDCKPRPLLKK